MSTLTLGINNTASALAASGLAVTDTLPSGMTVASPLNATNACGGTVTAVAGTSTIALTGGAVGTGLTCNITVDVTASTVGSLVNTTGNLSSSSGNSGTATDTLTVVAPPSLSKSFTDDPTAPGGTVTLQFTITNSTGTGATSIAFTDDLDATLSGLVATGLPSNDVCGSGSSLSGTSLLVLTGGSLSSGASCSFSVALQVPGAAAPGNHVNTTSQLASSLGSSAAATDTLVVSGTTSLTVEKTDSADPVPPGGPLLYAVIVSNVGTVTASNVVLTETGLSGFPNAILGPFGVFRG